MSHSLIHSRTHVTSPTLRSYPSTPFYPVSLQIFRSIPDGMPGSDASDCPPVEGEAAMLLHSTLKVAKDWLFNEHEDYDFARTGSIATESVVEELAL
ncbi:hypothetical protein OROHE_002798 [Orobanche hederae]